MANPHFLAALGAALTTGSKLSGRARIDRREEDQQKFDQEQELVRMALAREQADLAQKNFAADEQHREYGRTRDMLADAGPDAVLDPTAASQVEKVGLGFRLGPQQQETLTSKPFVMDEMSADPNAVRQTESVGLQAGRPILATRNEQFQRDQQTQARNNMDIQRRAQQAIQQPGYYKMPDVQRAVVWQQAGLGGNPPMSLDEWQARQDYEQGQALQRIGASQAGMMGRENPFWVNRGGRPVALRGMGDIEPGDAPWSNAQGGVNKPPTGAQQKVFGFYQRMEQANKTMEELEDTFGQPGGMTTKDLEIMNNSPLPDWANNRLLSPKGQQYAQAAKAWAEARLRKESGAAISLGEFKNDRTMGIYQGADAPEVQQQKRGFRKGTLDSFAVESGPAYEQYHGTPYSREGGGAGLNNGVQVGGGEEEYVRDASGRLVRKR